MEKVEHTFLFCDYAAEVWEGIKVIYGIHLYRRFFRTPRQWLFDILLRSTDIQATAITITIWHIWEARNGARNDEGFLHPKRIVEKTRAYVDMVIEHCVNQPRAARCGSVTSPLRWTPPPAGTVLINVDAAIFVTSRRMGIGAVILDDQGRCLSGFCEHRNDVTSPELAECLAMRRAIQFAQVEGHQHIILASDCLSVVQRLTDSALDRSTLGGVITDIKRIATSFSSCTFRHISR
jgi:hypothetical protein